tara:strand:- start:82 stop:624 length:543 start_codon:yes stop_codon:yes gene_type:complete
MEGWSSKRCALTWKLKGTPYNRSFFQLAVSVLPTEEIASGLLVTPTTREEVMDTDKFKAKMEKYDNGTTVPNLATQVVGLLPTPVVQYGGIAKKEQIEGLNKIKNGKRVQGLNLQDMAEHQMLPTPTTGADHKTQYEQGGKSLRCYLGQSSQLSPLFVEEMMGFPKNWTALPFQGGEGKA